MGHVTEISYAFRRANRDTQRICVNSFLENVRGISLAVKHSERAARTDFPDGEFEVCVFKPTLRG